MADVVQPATFSVAASRPRRPPQPLRLLALPGRRPKCRQAMIVGHRLPTGIAHTFMAAGAGRGR